MDQDFYEKLYDAKLESIKVRLKSMDKALELQAKEIERRMSGMNELREEFTSDRGQFVLKDSCTAKHKEVDMLSNRVAVLETRVIIYVGVTVAFFSLIQIALKYFK